MNEMQLNIPFSRLCRNYDKNTDVMAEKKADFLKSFRNVDIRDFETAIETIIKDGERFDRFPSVSEMWKYIKRSQKTIPERKYTDCLACQNNKYGLVTMILGFKIKDGADRVVERYHWSLAKKIELGNNRNDIRYYDYSFACRCERGLTLCNLRGGRPPPITPDEYEELKSFNKGGE